MTLQPGCLVVANRLLDVSDLFLSVWSSPDSAVDVCYLSIHDVCIVVAEKHNKHNKPHIMVVTPTNQVGWIDARNVRPA